MTIAGFVIIKSIDNVVSVHVIEALALIDRIANELSRDIVLRKNVFINFNLEKLLSALATAQSQEVSDRVNKQ